MLFRSRVFSPVRLLPAVQARRRVSAVVDDISVLIHVLSRRNLAVAVALFEAFRAVGAVGGTAGVDVNKIQKFPPGWLDFKISSHCLNG